MEFHENKAKTPFIGFVQLWQAVRRWWRQMQTRRVLQQMSDERLRDMGYAGRMWSELWAACWQMLPVCIQNCYKIQP